MPGFTPVNAVKKPPIQAQAHLKKPATVTSPAKDAVPEASATNSSGSNGSDGLLPSVEEARIDDSNGAQLADDDQIATSKFVIPTPTEREISITKTNARGVKIVKSNRDDTKVHMVPYVYPQQKTRALPALDLRTVKRPDWIKHDDSIRADRVFGLEHAPIFQPTEEEFSNPISYISKISEEGKKYGMVKVLPPLSWRLPFSLDTEMFWFKTRRQTLNTNGEEYRRNFLRTLYGFHKGKNNTPINKQPSIDKRELDLFRLYLSVQLKGGFEEVTNNKQWAQVGRELGYTGKIMTSLSTSLKSSYQRVLHPFEEYLKENGIEQGNITRLAAFVYDDQTHLKRKAEQDVDDERSFKRVKLVDGCEVSVKMSKDTFVKEDFPQILGSETTLHRVKKFTGVPSIPEDPLVPPHDAWHNGKAVIDDYHFEFKEAPSYNLRQFQQKALQYKFSYFRTADVEEDQVEKEFWRVVTDANEIVEVEYGAELPSSTHGSAYPQAERDISNAGIDDPWNSNVLPFAPGSLFRHLQSDVPQMVEPWLHVGMMFACQSWNVEDFFAYSINYHHLGDVKTWYSVPESEYEKFQKLLNENTGQLLESSFMLSPELLQQHDIKVHALDQRPGEIVIIFPKTYTAHFNHGFNLHESVNVIPDTDWLDYGLQCADLYRGLKQSPPFSIQKLLFDMANSDGISTELYSKLSDILRREELDMRNAVKEKYPHLVSRKGENKLVSCSSTEEYCFLSRIEHGDDTYSLKTFLEMNVNDNQLHEYRLVTGITDDELLQLIDKASTRTDEPVDWYKRLADYMSNDARPSLKGAKGLLEEAEGLRTEIFTPLKSIIDRTEAWTKRARLLLAQNEKTYSKEGSKSKASVEKFQNLLDEIKDVPLYVPEIDKVTERAQEIKEFSKLAKDALVDRSKELKPYGEYEALVNAGKELNIDLPEITMISRKVDQMKWHEMVDVSLRSNPDLETVTRLIIEGLRCDILESDESFDKLYKMKSQGQYFDDKVRTALKNELTFDEIHAYIREADSVPVSKDLKSQLYKRLEDNRPSSVEAEDNRPTYQIAKKMLEEARSISSKPNIFALEKEIRTVETWMRTGKRLFGKGNAPLYILNQHLTHVQQRNDTCFSLDDVYRPERIASRPFLHNSDSKAHFFCVCRQAESGMMLECDECHQWFHGRCLKSGRSKNKANNSFICPVCDHRLEIPRDAIRPRLEEIQLWREAGVLLPLKPTEQHLVDEIVEVASKFRQFLKEHIIKENLEDIGMIRFYLYKLEGAELILADETNFLRRRLHELRPMSDQPPIPVEVTSRNFKKSKAETSASRSATLADEAPPASPQAVVKTPGALSVEESPASISQEASFEEGSVSTAKEVFENAEKAIDKHVESSMNSEQSESSAAEEVPDSTKVKEQLAELLTD